MSVTFEMCISSNLIYSVVRRSELDLLTYNQYRHRCTFAVSSWRSISDYVYSDNDKQNII